MIAFFCDVLYRCCDCDVLIAPLFPQLYNTDSTTRHLAEYLIMTQAVFMPQNAFLHATYFTLRSGGKTVVTFFFDSVFVWIVSVPIAFVLSRFTGLFVVVIFDASILQTGSNA